MRQSQLLKTNQSQQVSCVVRWHIISWALCWRILAEGVRTLTIHTTIEHIANKQQQRVKSEQLFSFLDNLELQLKAYLEMKCEHAKTIVDA